MTPDITISLVLLFLRVHMSIGICHLCTGVRWCNSVNHDKCVRLHKKFLLYLYVTWHMWNWFSHTGTFIFAGTLIRTLGARNASRVLHASCLANILRSPMNFFDVTPLGRILNRFSKDVDAIDMIVPMNAHMFLMCFLHVLGTIVVISMGTPLFLSIILPLMVLYYLVQVQHLLSFSFSEYCQVKTVNCLHIL